jgi:hypothetical protein
MIPFIHRKSGRRYLMLGHAVDCTNGHEGRRFVVYCAEDDSQSTFVRDSTEFYEKFEICITAAGQLTDHPVVTAE